MTTPDEQPENNASEPVEPKVESIYIGLGRGSYSDMKDTEDTLRLFDRFLYPESGSMPDIDCNYVDGDRDRVRRRKELQEKHGVTEGETSKLYFERFLEPERADLPQPGDWFTDEQWEQRNKDMEYLTEKYSSKSPNTEASPFLDGYSDKDEFTRQAREGDNAFPIHNAEWYRL